jgi:hypothetical protein
MHDRGYTPEVAGGFFFLEEIGSYVSLKGLLMQKGC